MSQHTKHGCDHIFFIGFLGAGKSTLARNVGTMFKRRFIDTDRLVVRRCGKSVTEIFETEGEDRFRELETSALRSLQSERSLLVSCGGGIVETPVNIELMHEMGTCVYLEGDFEDSIRQIRRSDTRPDFRSAEHAARLLEQGRDAGDAVFDALDESDAAVEERLAGHDEPAARHPVEPDVHHGVGPECRASRDDHVEAADLADDAVVAGGVARCPLQVGVVRPPRERVRGVGAGGEDLVEVRAGFVGGLGAMAGKQLGEALFDKLGLPPRKKNARGYSTDAETLESLRPYSPVIDEILKYRTYAKLLSTYVDGLLNAEAADGRVHSTFIQTEARTGRISSTEPNLQNIPIRTELGSRLRGYFVAGAGETLVDADYSQIELRILAHITGDEHMQQAFLNGADIHRSTAAKIYHIPESEVTPQLRSASKAINFGIMYGKGAYSLSKDLGIPVKEADTFLKTYLDTFPKVDGYMKDCIAHAKDKGYVETLFGRRRALPELASSNFQVRASGERMARNTPIQGTAADIIKLAMVHVWQRLRDEKLQARLLLQVHDELIVEAPEEEIDEVKRILKEEMENVVHYSVPLTTEVGVGKTWLEAH